MKNSDAEYAYGIHAVESVLKNNYQNVLQVWVVKGRHDKRLDTILSLVKKYGISVEPVSADKIKNKCPDSSHQGVLAKLKVTTRSTTDLEDILTRENLLLLVLDEVQDPHNIGACLRSADAAGVDAVVVSKNRSPGITSVVRKVASGAADTVPFIQVSNLARALNTLRDNNVWVVGAAGGENKSIYDISVTNRTAIVMGSEGAGMRRLTRENCDELVSIPMLGAVESLNVSVATGICLFEVRRKLNSA